MLGDRRAVECSTVNVTYPPFQHVEAAPSGAADAARGVHGVVLHPRTRGRLAALALLFILLVLGTRIPFRSRYLFAWDSANFALALQQYSVPLHQPQPPGYILYVASAWLVSRVVPDPNAAYVWLSIFASAGSVALLLVLGTRLFGWFAGSAAATLLLTDSNFWGHGEVAYPYAFLSFFATLAAWLGAETRWGGRDLTLPMAAVIAVGAGFRQDLLAFLLPLWLYCCIAPVPRQPWQARHVLLRRLLPGLSVMAAIVTAWYVPMVSLSGGWAAYSRASGGYFAYWIGRSSVFAQFFRNIWSNLREVMTLLYEGIGFALVPAVYGIGRFFSPQRLVRDERMLFLSVWIAPAAFFYVSVHIGNPGYVLSFMPAVLIYVAAALEDLARDTVIAIRLAAGHLAERVSWLRPGAPTALALAILLTAGLASVNTVLFFVSERAGRYREIRAIDRTLERQIATIRRDYPPESTVIVSYDRSRQLRYYLPEYTIWPLFEGYDPGYQQHRTTVTVPAHIRYVVFPDLGRNTSDLKLGVTERDLGDQVRLTVITPQPGDTLMYGWNYATLRPRN